MNTTQKEVGLKNFLETIGKNLHAARKRRRLSLETVARELKIKPAVLQEIEGGEGDWEVNLVAKLCNYYNINPKEIICQEEV
jgi:transcriptional regulator with XRE-family HTH domain